nr:hypothetical protein [Tanacetum cinerariifolium]
MEVASLFVGPVVDCFRGWIMPKLRNLTSSAERIRDMGKKMEDLEGQGADIERHVEDNKANNRETPKAAEAKKYQAGKNALTHIEDMDRLIGEINAINWRDKQIPLGRLDPNRPPPTSGGGTQNLFRSRDKTFNDALKFLHDDDKTRVIALCGMDGVGKTTLMKQLKEAAKDNKMFNWIVVVVIGKTPNLLAIQKAIAEHIREPLTGTDETLMASHLSKSLSSFRAQIAIDVDADSVPGVVEVHVLKEDEARDLFCQIAGISAERNPDLYQIGCEIVKKCGCLPLAVKLIAATLNSQKKRSVWNHTLRCLKKNKIEEIEKKVQEIIEISYEKLKRDEDRAIFLLCGLFPEDSNILIEDLTRYAWGLKLLKQVYTIEEATDSTETSVSNLKNAYLLMDGDSHHSDCVKLHDLVLAFVVGTVSKGGKDGCWIIHHDDFSKWREDVITQSEMGQFSQETKKRKSKFWNNFFDISFKEITML